MTDEELAGHLDVSIKALDRVRKSTTNPDTLLNNDQLDILSISVLLRTALQEVRRLRDENVRFKAAVKGLFSGDRP